MELIEDLLNVLCAIRQQQPGLELVQKPHCQDDQDVQAIMRQDLVQNVEDLLRLHFSDEASHYSPNHQSERVLSDRLKMMEQLRRAYAQNLFNLDAEAED